MKIKIVECELETEIGIHDFERGRKQRLLVDVTLDVEPRFYGDDISSTLNYDIIRNFILEQSEYQFNLQETLCLKVLNFVSGLAGVNRACVYVRKVDVYPEVREVGVELTTDDLRVLQAGGP